MLSIAEVWFKPRMLLTLVHVRPSCQWLIDYWRKKVHHLCDCTCLAYVLYFAAWYRQAGTDASWRYREYYQVVFTRDVQAITDEDVVLMRRDPSYFDHLLGFRWQGFLPCRRCAVNLSYCLEKFDKSWRLNVIACIHTIDVQAELNSRILNSLFVNLDTRLN